MDNRINKINFRLQIASSLFGRISDYGDLDMIQCEEDIATIFPNSTFNKHSLDEKLLQLAQERAEILYASIDVQEQIALCGKQRTIRLRNEKEALAEIFNSEQLKAGFETDMHQQLTDIAIMTVMSNSALIFAKTFAPDDVERIEQYTQKVLDMKKMYAFFDRDLENGTYDDEYQADMDGKMPIFQISHDISQLYELNVMLATLVQSRFENGIRSLYFWQEKLGDKPKTIKTGDEFFDKFCNPRHEWEYEVEIQGLMRDRVDILLTRAKLMRGYQEMLMELEPQ